ncbi:hypothetical protein [Croceicoccus naphthovorans]|uniref:Uncharacterized protein n=1 Tax=Croceicoccus naphthovorans TaxID=1348774 RepID=A0A0G3XFA1_9SPHN|nr:hypothetical protein [Croceicoccus naphthovorans]AKM09326.1 hypothetical protein AB433_03965 [Croceicoccus naphthovorans]MBB3990236.1 hypothetical protein [Croceicoccus naphthovorans]
MLADNKLALNAGWDKEILAIEFQALVDLEFDIELTGFSLAEVDFVIEEAGEAGRDAADDAVVIATGPAVSRRGAIWLLGRHRLLCGDARSAVDFEALMGKRTYSTLISPTLILLEFNICTGSSCQPVRRTAYWSDWCHESRAILRG